MVKAMTRRTAREILIKIFYQTDVNGDSDSSEYIKRLEKTDDLKEYIDTCGDGGADNARGTGDQMDFIKAVAFQWDMHRNEIDELVEKYSINWKLDRMARMDLAIMREAAAEILYLDDVPCAVTINEAVELAKIYGTEKSSKFINAVLGKIAEHAE